MLRGILIASTVLGGSHTLLGCGERCPPPQAPAVASCTPYVEASGTYLVPPDGAIQFEPGTPLDITAVPWAHGAFELALPSNDFFRALGGGRVYFARDVSLHEAVTARRGTGTLMIGRVEDGILVFASNGRAYVVPCEALASTPTRPPEPARRPVPAERVRVLRGPASLMPGEVFDLWPGQNVELLFMDGDAAQIRFELEGFEYIGWVGVYDSDHGDVRPRPDRLVGPGSEDIVEVRVEQNAGGLPVVMLGKRDPRAPRHFGESCTGRATLRAGALMLSGPAIRRSPRDIPLHEIPALDRDVDVELRGALDQFRRIEIAAPVPGIVRIEAWVHADDLDRVTCNTPASSESDASR